MLRGQRVGVVVRSYNCGLVGVTGVPNTTRRAACRTRLSSKPCHPQRTVQREAGRRANVRADRPVPPVGGGTETSRGGPTRQTGHKEVGRTRSPVRVRPTCAGLMASMRTCRVSPRAPGCHAPPERRHRGTRGVPTTGTACRAACRRSTDRVCNVRDQGRGRRRPRSRTGMCLISDAASCSTAQVELAGGGPGAESGVKPRGV